jgi:hypothetical protein
MKMTDFEGREKMRYFCNECGNEVEAVPTEVAFCPDHPSAVIDSVPVEDRKMTSRIERLVEDLNAYRGDNFWQDVVLAYDLDTDAIEAADPAYQSRIVVLADGSEAHYRENRWVVTRV